MNTTPSNPTLVMKFGGTSVGSIKAMAQAVEIVVNSLAAWPRMVVVSDMVVLMIVSPFRLVMRSRSRLELCTLAGAAFIVRASADIPQGNRGS